MAAKTKEESWTTKAQAGILLPSKKENAAQHL